MPSNKRKLEQVAKALAAVSPNKVRLFFVMRHLKENVPRTSKMLDRHEFRLLRANLIPELQRYFLDLLNTQLTAALAKDGVEFVEYAIIDDTLDKIYTYPLNNAKSFADVIDNQIKKGVDIPRLQSLAVIKPAIWAYCISVDLPDHKTPLYSFRRITPSKVATDSKDLKERILCHFDTSDARLNIVKGETLAFDDKIDCLCLDDLFYVLRKTAFESLLGMEEEYKENAEEMVGMLKEADIIEGIDALSSEVLETSTYLKRMAHICRNGGCGELTPSRVERMMETAKKLNLPLRIKGGKLLVENKNDVVLVLRMLDKYYLECMQTGEAYGSHAKVRLAKAP